MQRYLSSYDDQASGWERALYDFLAEKQRLARLAITFGCATPEAVQRHGGLLAVTRRSGADTSW